MTRPIQMREADDFFRLSKALKHAGQTVLRRELNKELKEAVKPMLPLAQKAFADALPPGELQDRGGKVKQVVLVKTGRNPGVTIGIRYGKRGRGLGASNARLANRTGQVRHPLYGDRNHWYNTPVPRAQGWFDNTHAENAPLALPGIDRALQNVADQVVREVARG